VIDVVWSSGGAYSAASQPTVANGSLVVLTCAGSSGEPNFRVSCCRLADHLVEANKLASIEGSKFTRGRFSSFTVFAVTLDTGYSLRNNLLLGLS